MFPLATTATRRPGTRLPAAKSLASQALQARFADSLSTMLDDEISDEDDDEEYANWGTTTRRNLLDKEDSDEYTTLWAELMYDGGFGRWLFQSLAGSYTYLVVLGVVVVVSGAWYLLATKLVYWAPYLRYNRTSHTRLLPMAANIREFPLPRTLVFAELVVVHILLIAMSSCTRMTKKHWESAGLAAVVAPECPPSGTTTKLSTSLGSISQALRLSRGGIAGGGLLEYDSSMARRALPLALVLVVRQAISTSLYSSIRLPDYILAHIGIVPCAMLLAMALGNGRSDHIFRLPAMLATTALGVASFRHRNHVTVAVVLIGTLSSLLSALIPFQMTQLYDEWLAGLMRSGDPSANRYPKGDVSGSPHERRAFYQVLHYTSALTILLNFPLLVLSGELGLVYDTPRMLIDYLAVPTLLTAALAGAVTFISMLAFIRATSPFTASLMSIPQGTLVLCLTTGFSMSAGYWCALTVCWICCLYYLYSKSMTSCDFDDNGCDC